MKAFILTFSNTIDDLKNELLQLNIPTDDIFITSIGSEYSENDLEEDIRKHRPKVILLDGRFSPTYMHKWHEVITETVSRYDIEHTIYTFGSHNPKVPGSIYIKNLSSIKRRL